MFKSLLPRVPPYTRLPPPVHIPRAFRHTFSKPNQYRNASSLDPPRVPRNETVSHKGSSKSARFSKRPSKPGVKVGAPETLRKTSLPETGLDERTVLKHLRDHVHSWADMSTVYERLGTFGVPHDEIKPLLTTFAQYLSRNDIFTDLNYMEEEIRTIALDLSDPESTLSEDVQLTRLLYEWASSTVGQEFLRSAVRSSTLITMSGLTRAADLSDPAMQHETARVAPRRKVIMHVGPTNSGKTHNALRALAAAERGAYAGPLRLLASEIWNRLNKGQIVPSGYDVGADVEEDKDTVFDAAAPGDKPAVQKTPDSRFIRKCNLLTGDDIRIVEPEAPLVSCTIEMLPMHNHFDVAVIDEIQLLADSERGGAWTNGLLGVNAREIHLCGEESTVALVEKLLRDTGDELIVNRYKRLSPLTLSEESLEEDFSQIQKGDCYVAFSRFNIFKARAEIEAASGLRCAVAYGNLPPEVRTQQATLFNDPDSKYDVLVASDAVGMGLNLKIKRVVFETTQKFDGDEVKALSASAIKQIAGRAGRYGLHGQDASGGLVTTRSPKDLATVRDALAVPIAPLRKAKFKPAPDQISDVIRTLPAGTSLGVAPWVFHYVGKHHPLYELSSVDRHSFALEKIDAVANRLTLQERCLFEMAPIRWRSPKALDAAIVMIRLFEEHKLVDYHEILEQTKMDRVLKKVSTLMKTNVRKEPSMIMSQLEPIHATLVVYLWFFWRMPTSFHQRVEVTALKDEVEKMMQWCLEGMATPPSDVRRTSRRSASRDLDWSSSASPPRRKHKTERKSEQ